MVGIYVKLKWDLFRCGFSSVPKRSTPIRTVLFNVQTDLYCNGRIKQEQNGNGNEIVRWHQVHVDLLSNLFNLWTNVIRIALPVSSYA